MKPHTFFCRLFFIVCCVILTAAFSPTDAHAAKAQQPPVAQKPPAAKAQPKAKPKVEPRQSAAQVTKSEPSTSQTPLSAADDPLKKDLEVFAKDCIVKMNRQRKPGINHKEVITQPDGTFMARYMAVDPDSLMTSYNPTKKENKEIKYIGIMDYHEVEYVSMGKSAKQALAGPFNETNRTPVSELVKYRSKSKKWSY